MTQVHDYPTFSLFQATFPTHVSIFLFRLGSLYDCFVPRFHCRTKKVRGAHEIALHLIFRKKSATGCGSQAGQHGQNPSRLVLQYFWPGNCLITR